MSEELGIKARKEENFSEWYSEILSKADLIDYSKVSGCYVIKPKTYYVWEKIQEYFNKQFKEWNVKNCYFPMFIPESLLAKEAEHVEGFTPEVAWVEYAGNSKLKERLAIRPTSETIMYDHFARWIRSYRDLPLKINQWCNIVRWEFKHPTPFIRSREFLWQEGHTAFASKEEALENVWQALNFYEKAYKELLAIPCLKGMKTPKEKFAGAEFTLSLEVFLPNGRAAQACTSHFLGQRFAKAFEITFLDKDEKKKYVWQTSWGFTTRAIGLAIMMHSDNKGLVLPPRVADIQVVIVPIFKKENKDKIIGEARKLYDEIKDFFAVHLDDREDITPGFKFNDWELKGVPLRIELGIKEIENNTLVIVRRDNFEKITIERNKIKEKIAELLNAIHENLYDKARKFLMNNIVEVKNMEELKKVVKEKKIALAGFCLSQECEDYIKAETEGAKSLNYDPEKEVNTKCVFCGKEARYKVYFGKSY